MSWLPLLACAALLQTDAAQVEVAEDGAFVSTVFRVPKGVNLALSDMTGNGAQDLVWTDADGLEVWTHESDRRLVREPVRRLTWPEGRVAWTLCDLDANGAFEVALLVEGKAVKVHTLGEDGFDEGRIVLESTSLLPFGVSHMNFTRDVNGDGRTDLVLPGLGAHRIHLQQDDGTFGAAIQVRFDAEIEHLVGDMTSLDATFGQTLTVPWFDMRDVDGDGSQDLVSTTRGRVAFHLARPTLTSDPTWTLDLDALREELPKRDGIDLDDLLSNVTQRVDWKIEDLDGKGHLDLIVMVGSRFRVYLNGSSSGPRETPDQVLRASGNLLMTLVRQIEGDDLPELQMVRGERIGIGRILRYLILPGQLDFDLFTYKNEGGTFSRKPTRRNKIALQIPRLLALIDDDGIVAAVESQFDIPALRVASGDDQADHVMDMQDGSLVFFENCAPPPSKEEALMDGELTAETFFEGWLLEDLDKQGDGATKTIDLGDLSTFDFAPGAALRHTTLGKKPTYRVQLDPKHKHQFAARHLNDDGKADVLLVSQTRSDWIVTWLVQR
tara:strand:+ start:288 stop:1946 length:1659 start_codon:yes stop_codon:yes gene_type:complete